MAFTLGMGDIDFFKRINDKWGHDCGDAVLMWLARRISEELPDGARLCRWGGEEFIFFFPRENGDEICRFLDGLRMKLDNSPFDWRGEWIPITMTFGVEENDFRSDIDTLLKNVDNKLYIGKKQGRDLEGFFAIDVKSRREQWRIILQPLDENKEPFNPCLIDQISACVRIVEITEVSKHYE